MEYKIWFTLCVLIFSFTKIVNSLLRDSLPHSNQAVIIGGSLFLMWVVQFFLTLYIIWTW